MTSAKKALTITALLAGGYWLLRPRVIIKTLATNPVQKSVSYYMQYYNYSVKDTFVMGDAMQQLPVGDGKHFFVATGNPETGVVELHIGYIDPSGGFKSIKGLLVYFAPGLVVT